MIWRIAATWNGSPKIEKKTRKTNFFLYFSNEKWQEYYLLPVCCPHIVCKLEQKKLPLNSFSSEISWRGVLHRRGVLPHLTLLSFFFHWTKVDFSEPEFDQHSNIIISFPVGWLELRYVKNMSVKDNERGGNLFWRVTTCTCLTFFLVLFEKLNFLDFSALFSSTYLLLKFWGQNAKFWKFTKPLYRIHHLTDVFCHFQFPFCFESRFLAIF